MKSIKITGFFVLSAVCFVAQGAQGGRPPGFWAMARSMVDLRPAAAAPVQKDLEQKAPRFRLIVEDLSESQIEEDLQRDLKQEPLIRLTVEDEPEAMSVQIQKALDTTSLILNKSYFAMTSQELKFMSTFLPAYSIDRIIVKKLIENPSKSKEDIEKELMTELSVLMQLEGLKLFKYWIILDVNSPYKDWLEFYLEQRR